MYSGSYEPLMYIELLAIILSVLAAWFRLKYPHIAIGALAASAPILEFDNLVPWDGFFRIVSENFKVGIINGH